MRALTYLASQPEGEYRLTRQMAAALGIPAHYLAKVFQPLSARGILDSQRGRSGGVRLARLPEEISLYEVVDALECLDTATPCALGQRRCDDEAPCPLHDYWTRAHDRYLATLRTTSVAEMANFCERQPDSGYPFPTQADWNRPEP